MPSKSRCLLPDFTPIVVMNLGALQVNSVTQEGKGTQTIGLSMMGTASGLSFASGPELQNGLKAGTAAPLTASQSCWWEAEHLQILLCLGNHARC